MVTWCPGDVVTAIISDSSGYFNIYCQSFFGGHPTENEWGVPATALPVLNGGGATPVPIPNTVVKPSSVDGTSLETVRESRTVPA